MALPTRDQGRPPRAEWRWGKGSLSSAVPQHTEKQERGGETRRLRRNDQCGVLEPKEEQGRRTAYWVGG